MTDSVRGFSLGLGLQKDLRLELPVDTGNAKRAQEMADEARKSAKDVPPGASFDTAVDGTKVRLRFAISGEQVNQAIAEAVNTTSGPNLAELFSKAGFAGSSSTTTPVNPPKPVRKSAIIYGLDDGPKEVPLTKP